MPKRKLTDEDLAYAKTEYMGYKTTTEIAQALNVPVSTLQYHVDKGWKQERQLAENELIAEFGHTRAAKLNLLAKHSSDIIVKALENLKKRDKPPSMIEARAAVTIFECLDKIMRLDKGSPTDIISETKPITVIELKKQFEQIDPFQDSDETTKDIIETKEQDSSKDI